MLIIFLDGECGYTSPNLVESALNFEIDAVLKDAFYSPCKENMCISYLLLCDKINNCGNWEEESDCPGNFTEILSS